MVGTTREGEAREDEAGPCLSISLIHAPATRVSSFWQSQANVHEAPPALVGRLVDPSHRDDAPLVVLVGDDARTMEVGP